MKLRVAGKIGGGKIATKSRPTSLTRLSGTQLINNRGLLVTKSFDFVSMGPFCG